MMKIEGGQNGKSQVARSKRSVSLLRLWAHLTLRCQAPAPSRGLPAQLHLAGLAGGSGTVLLADLL